MKKEWLNEVDSYKGEYKGYKWLILRSEVTGALNGYVALPRDHPLYGSSGDDLSVHGGITFAEEGDGEKWEKGYWWLGFDCGHAGDVVPRIELTCQFMDSSYKNVEFVKSEIESLIEQIEKAVHH